ncbi:MAG: hypothetical protein ACPGVU_26840, partial [Limisphaerales bacterium]
DEISTRWTSDEPIAHHSFASERGKLAVVSTAGDAYVVNLDSDTKPTQIALVGEQFVDVCFTRSDTVVVAANQRNQVEFFDADTGLPVWESVLIDSAVTCIAAATDGKLILVGSETGGWRIPMKWIDFTPNASEWLPDLAEAMVRTKVTDRGRYYEMTWSETESALVRAKAAAVNKLPDWAAAIP